MATEPLFKRRWRVLLEQFAEDFGDGWQSEFARRANIHSTAIGKHLKGIGPDGGTVALAIERLRIDRDFFYDPTLGDTPNYRDFMLKPGASSAAAVSPRADDNAHWRRFVKLGLVERLGLDEQQVEWVRTAPFRGGAQSVDDYIHAAELVVRTDMPAPDGYDDAPAGRPVKIGRDR